MRTAQEHRARNQGQDVLHRATAQAVMPLLKGPGDRIRPNPQAIPLIRFEFGAMTLHRGRLLAMKLMQ